MEVVYNVKYKFKNNENKTNEELKEFENLFEEAKMIMLKWDESSMIKLKELKECLNKAVLQLYRLR